MIRLIEALNYRCLRYIRQPLGPFHVLVGPNASGKTTFLDVVSFLGRLVSDGLDAALEERTANFQDLVWNRGDGPIELAIEAAIPDVIRNKLPNEKWDTIRYEVRIGLFSERQDISILDESVLLKEWPPLKKNNLPFSLWNPNRPRRSLRRENVLGGEWFRRPLQGLPISIRIFELKPKKDGFLPFS